MNGFFEAVGIERETMGLLSGDSGTLNDEGVLRLFMTCAVMKELRYSTKGINDGTGNMSAALDGWNRLIKDPSRLNAALRKLAEWTRENEDGIDSDTVEGVLVEGVSDLGTVRSLLTLASTAIQNPEEGPERAREAFGVVSKIQGYAKQKGVAVMGDLLSFAVLTTAEDPDVRTVAERQAIDDFIYDKYSIGMISAEPEIRENRHSFDVISSGGELSHVKVFHLSEEGASDFTIIDSKCMAAAAKLGKLGNGGERIIRFYVEGELTEVEGDALIEHIEELKRSNPILEDVEVEFEFL